MHNYSIPVLALAVVGAVGHGPSDAGSRCYGTGFSTERPHKFAGTWPFEREVSICTCLELTVLRVIVLTRAVLRVLVLALALPLVFLLGFAPVFAMELPVTVFEHIPWVSC